MIPIVQVLPLRKRRILPASARSMTSGKICDRMTIPLRSLRRLAAISACCSGCVVTALFAAPPTPAERFPKPRWTWSRPKPKGELDAPVRRTPAATDLESTAGSTADTTSQRTGQEPLDPVEGDPRALDVVEEPVVKLRYVAADWEKVLGDVAESTGSTLVLMDTPKGRFSRQDFARYTRGQAVQILNRELEPNGYRILEKDKLTCIVSGWSIAARKAVRVVCGRMFRKS
jgi:hypothetical protein